MKKYRLHLILVIIGTLLIIYKIIPISDKSFKADDEWIKRIEDGWQVTNKDSSSNNGTCLKIKHILRFPLIGPKF